MSARIKTNIFIRKSQSEYMGKRVFSGYLPAMPNSDTIIFLDPDIGGYAIRSISIDVTSDTIEINLRGSDDENLHPEVEDLFD